MSTKGSDFAAIIGKGVLGAIPFVGPLAAEIIGTIIPNQRIDRIESLLKILESKIPKEDIQKVERNINSPQAIDLIEDGFIHGSRALSEERKEYIASLLKNSLTDDEVKYIHYKRLLSILSEINDLEVLILKSKVMHRLNPDHEEFWNKHRDVLMGPTANLGSSQDSVDQYTIHQTHRSHLVFLGLLKAKFKNLKRGELPEFDDKTGMIKANGYDISSLGRLLLRAIDQCDEV
jgi:hypothetical protein